MSKVSINQQIEEVDYELGQRAKVYPRLAAKGSERQAILDYHVRRMEAVRGTLEFVREHEEGFRLYGLAMLALKGDVP